MPVEEWGQTPIIFCGKPLQPRVVLEYILNHERVNVLSRDFVGREKTDVVVLVISVTIRAGKLNATI